jgi:hypothetical protein
VVGHPSETVDWTPLLATRAVAKRSWSGPLPPLTCTLASSLGRPVPPAIGATLVWFTDIPASGGSDIAYARSIRKYAGCRC